MECHKGFDHCSPWKKAGLWILKVPPNLSTFGCSTATTYEIWQHMNFELLQLVGCQISNTLPKFNSEFTPKNRPGPKRKRSSSNYPFFRGELLNFGGGVFLLLSVQHGGEYISTMFGCV